MQNYTEEYREAYGAIANTLAHHVDALLTTFYADIIP